MKVNIIVLFTEAAAGKENAHWSPTQNESFMVVARSVKIHRRIEDD